MEIKFIDCEYKDKMISLSFSSSKIYGITGKNAIDLLPMLSLKEQNKGQIVVNGEKTTKENINEKSNEISIKNLKSNPVKKSYEDIER